MTPIPERLRARTRTAGGEPLITYYDLTSGERTELSATTFANWAAKTANLLLDLSVAPGDLVGMPLARTAPGHWITAVWELACWQTGTTVAPMDESAAVCVCGPDWEPYAGRADELIACSLAPFPMGLRRPTPPDVTDFDLTVRAQPDQYAYPRTDPAAPAWLDADRRLTHAELAEVTGEPLRRLVRPTGPWRTARDGIVTALATGGSVVVVVGDDESALARIVETERVDQT